MAVIPISQAGPRPTRQGLSKVRTGCITCKRRKVKCDEQKPACLRCIKTSWVCGGYGTSFPKKDRNHRPNVKRLLLPAPYIQDIPELACQNERRSLDFFRSITAHDLALDYDGGFWINIVLKFSHIVPSVLHAVVALSSLHESLIYDGSALDTRLAEKQVFAFQQYNKAILLLRDQINNPGDSEPLAPLLLCIMFVCMEFMQRKNVESLSHLRQGRQLLHITLQSKHLSSDQIDIIRRDIVPLYMRSGLTSYLFGIDTLPVPESLNQYSELPRAFASIPEARHAFYAILDDSLRWRFRWKTSQCRDPRVPTDFAYKTVHQQTTPLTPAKIEEFDREKKALLSRLSRWFTAFSIASSSIQWPGAPTPLMLLLQILYHTIIIWTSTAMSDSETDFDEHTERFSTLLPLCARYLEATKAGLQRAKEETLQQNKLDRTRHRKCRLTFTFDTGIVPVLFLIGAKCRHPQIRRGAVDLLLQQEERYENLWNAQCFARIASRLIDLETQSRRKFRQETSSSMSGQPQTAPWQVDQGDFCRKAGCCTQTANQVQDYYLRTDIPEEAESDECSSSTTTGSEALLRHRAAEVCGDLTTGSAMAGLMKMRAQPGQLPAKLGSGLNQVSDANKLRGNDSDPAVSECAEDRFGLPEHVRISDAIVGQHEETGITVTFFRKPNRFNVEWEIWEEFIRF